MKESTLFYLGIILLFENYYLLHGLKVLQLTPGPPALESYDSEYIEDIILKTRRTEKRGQLAFNIEFTSKKLFTNNNVSIHFIFYEYLHNEYRRSFIEMHYKICDVILKDNIVGPVVRKTELNICPIPPGRYHLMNMTFNEEFPSVWPFEKGRCVLIATQEPSGKVIAQGGLVLTFKMVDKV